MSDKVV